jgi:hypothetical protein
MSRFLGHLAIATYGIVGFSLLLEFVLIRLTGDRPFWDHLVIGPAFALPIVFGLLIGYRFGRRLPASASRFIWVPLFLLFVSQVVFDFVDYRRLQFSVAWVRAELWNNYIGMNCSGSDCINEILFTAPLVAAFAYALGAELGRSKTRTSRIIGATSSQSTFR